MVLAWAIFYLVNSFHASELPWETCDNPWSNQSTCISHTASGRGIDNRTGKFLAVTVTLTLAGKVTKKFVTLILQK